MLAHHTGGLPRYIFSDKFNDDVLVDVDKIWTQEERLSYIFDVGPIHPAGQGWYYCRITTCTPVRFRSFVSSTRLWSLTCRDLMLILNTMFAMAGSVSLVVGVLRSVPQPQEALQQVLPLDRKDFDCMS